MDNVHTLQANLASAPEPFTCEDAKMLGVPALLIGGDGSPRLFP